MNYLEEIEFSRGLPEFDKVRIERQLAPIMSDQKQLLNESAALANDVEKHISRDQIAIVNDIHSHNAQLLKPNEVLLHECINNQKEFGLKIDKFRSGKASNPNPLGSVKEVEVKLNGIRHQIIEELESIDFTKIATINKLEEVWAPSFNKVWIWILEVYFGYPSSKYHWDDFSVKAMSKKNDSGKELKRRMIITDSNSFTMFQIQELEDLVKSHRKLLLDKTNFTEFNHFLHILSLIYNQCELNREKVRLQTSGKDSLDIQKIREEEERALLASQKLNQTRFDLISDVQNLYLLIDNELN
jgi:hypothetical protein